MSSNSSVRRQASSVKNQGKQAVRNASASPLMQKLFRLGYIVRGLVYAVIGLLALQVAFGSGGAVPNQQGAIATLGSAPGGQILLYVILIGLVGYALWGVVRAVVDPLHYGNDAKGTIQRLGFLVSGLAYGYLALQTYNVITAKQAASSGSPAGSIGPLLTQPFGPVIVGLIGLVIIGVGVFQIIQGVRPNFGHQFLLEGNGKDRVWIKRLGRYGTVARGVVFALIGVYLVQAAYTHDPSRAKGIDGVLSSMLRQPAGPWLLAIVAAGLVAFGIYSAMIRRMTSS